MTKGAISKALYLWTSNLLRVEKALRKPRRDFRSWFLLIFKVKHINCIFSAPSISFSAYNLSRLLMCPLQWFNVKLWRLLKLKAIMKLEQSVWVEIQVLTIIRQCRWQWIESFRWTLVRRLENVLLWWQLTGSITCSTWWARKHKLNSFKFWNKSLLRASPVSPVLCAAANVWKVHLRHFNQFNSDIWQRLRVPEAIADMFTSFSLHCYLKRLSQVSLRIYILASQLCILSAASENGMGFID